MKIEQVAAITWTIRDFVTTADAFRESMKKLADIGYKAVQVSSRPPKDEMSDAEIAAACNEAGLVICATHEHSKVVLNEPEKVVETLKNLGCKYTAYPFPMEIDFTSESVVTEFISKLDKSGAVLRDAGQVLTYHNHANEFYKLGGKTILSRIYDESDPQNLQAEIDTYWVQLGGGCPLKWCESLKGRLPLLHMKDVGVREGNAPIMHEIGYGNLDFKAIIAAAEASGCEWFIVEQDECPNDPFESLKMSFDFIKANLID